MIVTMEWRMYSLACPPEDDSLHLVRWLGSETAYYDVARFRGREWFDTGGTRLTDITHCARIIDPATDEPASSVVRDDRRGG